MGYFLLVAISLASLLTIGLLPLYVLIFATAGGEEGIIFILLSQIFWGFGFIISKKVYENLYKKFRLKTPSSRKALLILLCINLLGAFSIFPAMPIFLLARNSIVTTDFRVVPELINETITFDENVYTYNYTIAAQNNTNKTFRGILTEVRIGFFVPDSSMDFLSMTSDRKSNTFIKTYPPGLTILEGSLKLRFVPHEELFEHKYPVQLEVRFQPEKYLDKKLYLDSTIPGIQDLIYSELEKKRPELE